MAIYRYIIWHYILLYGIYTLYDYIQPDNQVEFSLIVKVDFNLLVRLI